MYLELFLHAFEIYSGAARRPEFGDMRVHAPALFRKDRPRNVRVTVSHESGYASVSLVDGAAGGDRHAFASSLLRDAPQDATTTEPGNDPAVLPSSPWEGGSDEFLTESDYGSVLPHGPVLRCRLRTTARAPGSVEGVLSGFTHPLPVSCAVGWNRPRMNAGLIDGLLQVCALLAVRERGRYVLPVGASLIRANAVWLRGAQWAYVRIRMAKESFTFQIDAWRPAARRILAMRDVSFHELVTRPGERH
jgi:hypothetical protein